MHTTSEKYHARAWQRARQVSVALFSVFLILAPAQALINGRSAASAATLSVCHSGCAYTTIQAAVGHAAPGDTVSVAAGTYGEHVTIATSLTLAGAGAGQTIVDGSATGTAISVTAGVSVMIAGLTVQNGVGNISYPASGGGIVNAGTLTVADSVISHNGGSAGGPGLINRGALTLRRSIVSDNGGSGGLGGIVNSGTLALFASTVSDNFSGSIGGIANSGTATLTDSVVSGNDGVYGTGGIANSGTLTLVRSTVARNDASRGVGGIGNGGTATLINSTVSGNNASGSVGTGGIANQGALTVIASTVAGNIGTNTGGIDNAYPSSVMLADTIVARNTTSLSSSANPSDCNGTFTSGGYNLIGVAVDCSGLVNGVNGDRVGSLDRALDPRLGPLQDNGGPTPTQALLPGSPAIDAIPREWCGVATDQRSFARPYPAGGRCDIGAFEFGASSATGGGTATATATTGTPSGGATGTPTTPASTPTASGANGVTIAGSVTGNSGPYFGEEDVALTNTAPLTALRIVVTVRKTPGVSYAGQYNTFWYGELAASYSETADALVYTFALRPGQTVPPSSGLRVAAQFNGDGAPHDFSGDSYTVSYTSAGGATTASGTFGPPAGGPSSTASPTPATSVSPTASPTPAGSGGAGFLTASGRAAPNNGPYYGEEDVVVTNTAPLAALTITVTVGGVTVVRGPFGPVGYLGQYNTFPAGALTQGHRVNTYNMGPGTPDVVRSIDYTYTLNAGQVLQPGAGRLVAAQFTYSGAHDDSSDTYTVTATSVGGAVTTASGHF